MIYQLWYLATLVSIVTIATLSNFSERSNYRNNYSMVAIQHERTASHFLGSFQKDNIF